jgi:hypothetical protein
MINAGVDLMGNGGRLASAHSEADVEHTLAAFRETLRQMRSEQLL